MALPIQRSLPVELSGRAADLLPEAGAPIDDPREDSREALPIFVTQPHLPPLEEFLPSLQAIWDSRVLTNGGPFHQQLEQALAEHLGVSHLALMANATLGLVTALQALRITGEVITTPYSFVATSHALLWNGIKPVFVDIDPESLNIDPARIEAAITPQTTAILGVHCYGRACDVQAIQSIADAYNLKVIYDAAHAFGVDDEGGSLLRHGDLSVLSFHATKVFNTFEGGGIVCPDARTKRRIDHLKNFGFVDETTVVAAGINGKMNEFSAALGLVQLRHVEAAIARRREIDRRYREALADLPGLVLMPEPPRQSSNHSYFPVLVGPGFGCSRDTLYERLKRSGIHARRYFYPLISEFPMYRGLPSAQAALLPVARRISQQVLCLPIHPGLTDTQVDRVITTLRRSRLSSVG
jgi:dTDP-4-amino-4,6-dideoxygalactose transaminase